MKRCRSEFEAWRYLADQASVRRFPRTEREAFRLYGNGIVTCQPRRKFARSVAIALVVLLMLMIL
jgi:hypothetical protein